MSPKIIQTFRERFREFISADAPPLPVTEMSTIQDVAVQYPGAITLLSRKYGISLENDDRSLSLKALSEKYGLPAPQILFMEVQLNERGSRVQTMPPLQAKAFLEAHPQTRLLDVREDWEISASRIRTSEPLNAALLDELLTSIPKQTPLILYCHFGIRSVDAASFLADRGFTEVYVLEGGIDAWSQQIDPSIPRYDKAYC